MRTSALAGMCRTHELIAQPSHLAVDGLEGVYEVRQPLTFASPPSGFDWRTPFEWLVFVLLLGVGFGVLLALKIRDAGPGAEGEVLWLVAGGTLFNAGQTPLLMSLLALVTGFGTRRRRDAVRVLVAAVLFGAGVTILVGVSYRAPEGGVTEEGAENITEDFLFNVFETGAFFFIYKFFFLEGDEEEKLLTVAERLREVSSSPGAGLALGYFYNFVQPVVRAMEHNGGAGGELEVTMDAKDKAERVRTLRGAGGRPPRLHVLVPRDLSRDGGQDLKQVLQSAQTSRAILRGLIKGQQGHRDLQVFFLKEEGTECAGLFDLPTAINACASLVKDLGAARAESDAARAPGAQGGGAWARMRAWWDGFDVDEVLAPLGPELASATDITVPRFVADFSNYLLGLVRLHGLEERVALVSVPQPPLDFGALERSIAASSAAQHA